MNALVQTLRNLGPARLAAVIGGAILVLAILIYLATRLGGTEMTLLYGELSPADAGRIDQRLDQLAIHHELRGDGAEIFAPMDQVARARVLLAADGLPSGGSIGYEIFDKSQGLATSSFVQNINQLRALEGELGRTITGIEAVKAARVHLVLPQRELFTRERQEPSASILLRMAGPQRLERGQVRAIQHIVATAVPGLKPARISIVDERGTLLAKGEGEGDGTEAALADAEEARAAYETRIARQIEELLERTLGPDRARAEVAAELDYNRVSESQESYNPDQQVVRSTQSVADKSEQNDNDGAPSVTIANNLPQGAAQPATAALNASKSARDEETVNYEIGKTVRNQAREPGAIRRLSVAVLVDGSYTPAEGGPPVYAPRSAPQLAAIETLVKTAIGYDAQRGDQVDIVNLPFAANLAEPVAAARLFGLERQDLLKISEIMVLGVIGALVLFLVVKPLAGRLFEGAPENAGPALLGPPAELRQIAGPAATMLATAEDQPPDLASDEMIDLSRIDGRIRVSSLRRIGDIVDQHPEDVVSIIRGWLYQEA